MKGPSNGSCCTCGRLEVETLMLEIGLPESVMSSEGPIKFEIVKVVLQRSL